MNTKTRIKRNKLFRALFFNYIEYYYYTFLGIIKRGLKWKK